MQYLSKLTPYVRKPSRLVAVAFVLALSLVVQSSTALAWSAPGDPSELHPDPVSSYTFQTSCSVSVIDAPLGAHDTDGGSMRGVCLMYNDSAQFAQFFAEIYAGPSSYIPQTFTLRNSSTMFQATLGGSGGLFPELLSFTVEPCDSTDTCWVWAMTYGPKAATTGRTLIPTAASMQAGGYINMQGGGSSTCSTCRSSSVDEGTPIQGGQSESDPITPPRWYFTDPYSPPLANRCEAVKIGVQYKGDALFVSDYDTTFYPANGQPGRDDFVFVATFTDWNYLTDPGGMNLEYRWPGTATWSPAFFGELDSIAFNGGDDSAVTFRIGTNVGRYLSQVQWKCTDSLDGDRFLPFFDPGPSVNDPAWQSFTAFANPCEAIVITTPTGTVAPGQTARLQYTLETSEGLDLAVFAYGVATFSPSTSPSIPMYSSSALGTATGGPPPFDHGVAPGSGVLTFTLPSTVDAPVAYADLVFACTDLVVSGVIVPGSADLGIIGTVDPPDDPTCWEQGGMSLTSPASWITGIAKMLSCSLRELFIPDSDTLTDSVALINETMADRPPFIAVYVVLGFANDLNDSFQGSSGTGCFEVGQIPGVTAEDEICASGTVDVTNDQRSALALFFVGPMILGMAGHMLGLLRSGQTETYYLANEMNPRGIDY